MGDSEKKKIPDAPIPSTTPSSLLSNIAPPTDLPNFITAPVQMPSTSMTSPVPVPISVQSVLKTQPAPMDCDVEPGQQTPDKFSPAIPLSKGQPTVSIRSPEASQTTQSSNSLSESIPDIDKLGDIMPGSGLLTWMKGAVSSGGILHKVAEKAKSSVDSMITTLDPQMKEYLNSGGDMYVVVASDKEVKISPVREAFQAVFGKATVVGCPAQSEVTAEQPVGYAAAYAAAKQRIAHIRSSHTEINNNVPIVAIEGFLHEAVADKWYDVALLVLSQPSLGIELQMQSQGTPVPSAAIAAAKAATSEDYVHAQTGFSVTIGSIMADSLHVPNTQWQEASTGVSRRDLLLLSSRALAGSYKNLLAICAAQN